MKMRCEKYLKIVTLCGNQVNKTPERGRYRQWKVLLGCWENCPTFAGSPLPNARPSHCMLIVLHIYVLCDSDFFTNGFWDNLPEGWTEELSCLDPPDLAFLLDSSLPIPKGKDLPLTLLEFRNTTQTLSLDRQKVDLENEGMGEGLFPSYKEKERTTVVSPHSGVTTQNEARSDIRCGQYLPLNACFRTHVKPKKQHEILQLGKAIQLLGLQCSCDHIVDVGAGQGHLSRLLAFGHGFKVTTVEAAGCHAPKAQKMDKDFQKKIQRKLKRKHETGQEQTMSSLDGSEEDPTAGQKTSLPDHVTCLIEPGTSAGKFLKVVRDSYRNQTNILDSQDRVPGQDSSNISTGPRLQGSEIGLTYLKSEKTNSPVDDCTPKTIQPDHEVCCGSGKDNNQDTIPQSKSVPSRCSKSGSPVPSDQSSSPVPSDQSSSPVPSDQSRSPVPNDQSSSPVYSDQSRSPVPSDRSSSPVPREMSQFILTGLHACGDLTPTMLRIFAQCPDIIGLASVACCYMKMSCSGGEANSHTGDFGYPMSQFTSSLKDSHLSFEAREMACHFADSYKERLLANPPSLKSHCYRAALQCIIKQQYPDFIKGTIRLSIKLTDTMTFESYVRTGLKRLGFDPNVPTHVLQEGQSYLPYWQNVVAFYTLRLSLAPVVESLILLDRMVYLYEQGIPSVLLPIFDPALSPRNFVLLASRKSSLDVNNS